MSRENWAIAAAYLGVAVSNYAAGMLGGFWLFCLVSGCELFLAGLMAAVVARLEKR